MIEAAEKVVKLAKGRTLDEIDMPKLHKGRLKGLLTALKRGLANPEVYLFRSFARGDWLYESDIDVIITSDSFAGMDWLERVKLIKSMAPKGEPLMYAGSEFEEKKRSEFIKDALSCAIKLL